MSFRSFQHNYHEGQLTNIAVGPRREVTLEVQLNAWCDKTATMATVRLDAIENFEEVRTFLAQAGRGPTELDCLRLLTEGPNWVFLGFSDGRSITIRSHHVTESEQRLSTEPDAGPNDEERGQPPAPMRESSARSSSSVSFVLGGFACIDIADVLKKHTKMPFERLRVARHLDELSMSTIRRGVVFIFAVWSGPTIIAFERFTRVLANVDTTGLDLAVLDTDCLTSEAGIALWGRNVGGGGETLWVRDGVAVARSLLYVPDSEPELVRHT